MANPTTNFGWVMPTSASLVTNLPADFNTFGQAVDTSMAQLKGGTTGQVLSKTSGTDMAFTWVTPSTGATLVGVGVYKGTNQSISSGTATAVSFASEYFDTDAFHDNATNNSRLTIPTGKGGKYQINYNVNWDANATGSRQAIVYLNNATVISLVETNNAGAGRGIGLSGSLIYSLAAGDYIQVLVFQNSGGALDVLSGGNPTTFSISYLGA